MTLAGSRKEITILRFIKVFLFTLVILMAGTHTVRLRKLERTGKKKKSPKTPLQDARQAKDTANDKSKFILF